MCVRRPKADMKLHIGSGTAPIEGWTNVDIASYPGVDFVVDVRAGLPFEAVELIFAEHFIEHLTLEEGFSFLRECRRVLRPTGILRLSTPNLDWVWLTHYNPPEHMDNDEQLLGCLEVNRAFHGWGHQFIYNTRTLSLALTAAGFVKVLPQSYGESDVAQLRGLERHERHADQPRAPSVIVIEASGVTEFSDAEFSKLIAPYVRDSAVK